MSIALELLAREAALVLVLGLLGSGLAAFLPAGFPLTGRVALAPAFGLALGAAILASVAEVMPMKTAAWAVLVPLALASAAVCAWRARAAPARLERPSQLVFPAAVVVLVLAALNAPLIANSSLGPMQYQVGDAAIYVGNQELLKERTLAESEISLDLPPRAVFGPLAIEAAYGSLPPDEARRTLGDLKKVTNLVPVGATTVGAATSALFGWHAVDSQTAYLASFVLIGALAAFGCCMWLTRISWASAAAGLLFAGPVTYQLYVDSSEAALAALALMPAIGLAAILLLRSGDWTAAVLLGVLLAGMQASYPLWIPFVGVWALLTVAIAAIVARRAGALDSAALKQAIERLLVVAAIAVLLSPVAFERGLTFIHLMATSDLLEHLTAFSLPTYDLAVEVIPGWLLGMREFYSLPRPEHAGLDWTLTGVLAPAALLAVAAVGAWRFRRQTLVFAVLVPVATVLAYQSWLTTECSYCVQRSLLPLEPAVAIFFGLGLVGITQLHGRRAPSARVLRVVAVVIGVSVIGIAALRDSQLARRAVAGGFMLNQDARAVTREHAEGLSGIHLEAPQVSGNPLVESNALYQSVRAATGAFPSVAANEYISTFGGRSFRSVSYEPDHRYIVTRVAGVDSGRRTLYTAGPYALQVARRPLDVTVERGIVADLPHRDPTGQAWVHGPLELVVSSASARPAWVRLELEGEAVRELRPGGGFEIVERDGEHATVCVRVPSSRIGKVTTVDLGVEQTFAPPPDPLSNVLAPDESLRLAAMRATAAPCEGNEGSGSQ